MRVSRASRRPSEPAGIGPSSGAPIQVVGSDSGSRFVQLGIGKSVVIDLPRDIKDVLVAEPKFANAVVRSTRRAYLIGVAVGQTNIYFFDAEGKQIAGFDVAVTRDLNGVRAMLQKLLPNSDVRVDGVGDGVMLSGSVANAAESQQAYDVASRLVGNAEKVVNNLTIRGRDQVMLKVTVAEVQRDIIKQLGIDLNASLSYGTAVLNFNNSNPFTALGQPLVDGNGAAFGFKGVSATLRAMERAGVIRTLAEPNLTAISGESANFLAGGEFPVPAGYTCDPQHPRLSAGDPVQEVRRRPELHAGRDVGRPHQPEGHDRSVRALEREFDPARAGFEHADHSGDQDPPRRDHGGNSLRRRARDGRHDPGADQASDQRHARPDAGPRARHAVQEPRLRQPPDRADGDRHAVHRARGVAEGPVAAG